MLSSLNKKAIGICIFVLFLGMLSGIVRGEESRKGNLSLRFNGGLYFVNVKDINDCIQSREDNPARYSHVDWKKTRSHPEFSLEAVYFLSEKIGIGLGAGYAFFHNSGSYQTDPYTTRHEKWDWSAIPVFANIYMAIPIQSRWTLLVKGGAGYYFGTLDGYKDVQWDYRPDTLDYGITREDIDATSGAFAAHAGLGLDFKISNRISISLDADYRFLKMKDFKGTEQVQTDQNSVRLESYQNEGYLWHSEFGSASIHDSFFQNEPRSDLQVQRHAEYDLNGMTIRLGFIYSFASLFQRNP